MPLFVDGVEIKSVFVDGVEQGTVWSDGVQVFSKEPSGYGLTLEAKAIQTGTSGDTLVTTIVGDGTPTLSVEVKSGNSVVPGVGAQLNTADNFGSGESYATAYDGVLFYMAIGVRLSAEGMEVRSMDYLSGEINPYSTRVDWEQGVGFPATIISSGGIGDANTLLELETAGFQFRIRTNVSDAYHEWSEWIAITETPIP